MRSDFSLNIPWTVWVLGEFGCLKKNQSTPRTSDFTVGVQIFLSRPLCMG